MSLSSFRPSLIALCSLVVASRPGAGQAPIDFPLPSSREIFALARSAPDSSLPKVRIHSHVLRGGGSFALPAFAIVGLLQSGRFGDQVRAELAGTREPRRECDTPVLPNYSLSTRYVDNGMCIARWKHHAMKIVLSGAVSSVLIARHDWSPREAGVAAVVATSVIPHVIGVATGAYVINGVDWVADAWIASLPIALGEFRHGARRGVVAVAAWAAVYGLVYPYTSP